MALQNTISHLKEMLTQIAQDLNKAENGNKAAAQRVRTTSVRFEKLAKTYRKESIHSERQGGTKGARRTAKKPAPTKPKAKAKTASAKLKAKPKAKAALARPRALSFKQPSAKLPVKRAGFR